MTLWVSTSLFLYNSVSKMIQSGNWDFANIRDFRLLGTSGSCSGEAEMGNHTVQTPGAFRDPLEGPGQRRPQRLPEYRPTGFADGRQLLEGPFIRMALPQLTHQQAVRQQ